MTRLLRIRRPRDEAGDGPDAETVAQGDGAGGAPDADTVAGGDGTEGEQGKEASAPRPSRTGLRRAAPATAAVALVLAGCGFFHHAHELRTDSSARNRALTDTEATTRVAGDVGSALARVFSYAPDGLAATERSARSVLTGRAARQYAELMERVRADLAGQRVTLSTQAVRTGVVELDGDTATLLVFLDQISHRGKEEPTTAAAQLTVTVRRHNDRWRIADIKAR